MLSPVSADSAFPISETVCLTRHFEYTVRSPTGVKAAEELNVYF
jgi:hypothetical protein